MPGSWLPRSRRQVRHACPGSGKRHQALEREWRVELGEESGHQAAVDGTDHWATGPGQLEEGARADVDPGARAGSHRLRPETQRLQARDDSPLRLPAGQRLVRSLRRTSAVSGGQLPAPQPSGGLGSGPGPCLALEVTDQDLSEGPVAAGSDLRSRGRGGIHDRRATDSGALCRRSVRHAAVHEGVEVEAGAVPVESEQLADLGRRQWGRGVLERREDAAPGGPQTSRHVSGLAPPAEGTAPACG